MVESQERQRAALDLATKYANTVHETSDFIDFYNSVDPKVYEDMCKVIEFSDEQEHMAKAIYSS